MILITGATGFLGYHLIPLLAQQGYAIRALVRSASNTTLLESYGVDLVYADDITDADKVYIACQGCDTIVHGAGHFRFWGDPRTFWQTNVVGTEAMLAGALASHVSHFIHISTIALVGQTSKAHEISEKTICFPQDAYQASKLAGEQRVLAAYYEQGLPVTVLRPGAFYGPGGRYAFNRLFFEEPLRGWRIKVNGGRHITFPVYVPDVVQGILLTLKTDVFGQVYNICGEPITHNEANQIISELAGIGSFRFPVHSLLANSLAYVLTGLSHITGREPFYSTDLSHYVFQDWLVSIRKAKEELGFVPTPFYEGAKETLLWYQQQK